MYNPNNMYGYPPYNRYDMYNNPMGMGVNQSPTRSEIIKVNGENGARAFQLAPNSSALLLDESAPIVWLVQSDGAGYKTVSPYTITPYQAEPPINARDLEARISRLEGIINEQSDTASVKRNTNTNANTNKSDNK